MRGDPVRPEAEHPAAAPPRPEAARRGRPNGSQRGGTLAAITLITVLAFAFIAPLATAAPIAVSGAIMGGDGDAEAQGEGDGAHGADADANEADPEGEDADPRQVNETREGDAGTLDPLGKPADLGPGPGAGDGGRDADESTPRPANGNEAEPRGQPAREAEGEDEAQSEPPRKGGYVAVRINGSALKPDGCGLAGLQRACEGPPEPDGPAADEEAFTTPEENDTPSTQPPARSANEPGTDAHTAATQTAAKEPSRAREFPTPAAETVTKTSGIIVLLWTLFVASPRSFGRSTTRVTPRDEQAGEPEPNRPQRSAHAAGAELQSRTAAGRVQTQR